MSVWTHMRFALARWLLKAGGLRIVPSGLTESILMPSFEALTRDAYQKNSVVFACISALAFDLPEPPMRVYADDDPDADALPRHPLRRLLMRPNALMGERELWMYTAVYAALGGNAYWHIVRSRTGQPVELWPYHYGQMRPLPSAEPNAPWVRTYEFTDGDGQLIPIDTADVVHFKWPSPDPKQPWQSQPPLLAAAAEVDADNEATRYLRALLRNDAVPRTIVSQSEQRFMTDDEVKRAKAQFKSAYGGEGRGDVLVLEAGANVTRLGLDLQELAFEALHKVPEKRIAASFRVPLSVAGIGDDPTYSNSEEAYRRYVQSTLSPLWALWGSEVQRDLADDLNVFVRHDTSQVAALQEDKDALWARVDTAFKSGRLTLNQANRLCGLPDVPGGDVYLWSASIFPVPAAQIGVVAETEAQAVITPPEPPQLVEPIENEPVEDDAEQEEAEREERARKQSLVTARRQARMLQRLRRNAERRLERALTDYFDELAATMVRRAEDSAKQADLPDIDELILDEDGQGLLTLLQRFYVDIMQASWSTWNAMLAIDVAFETSDPAVVETLATAARRVTMITDTTRTAIQALLQFGAEQGWSISQFVEGSDDRPGLRAVVQETYRNRARAIARTEIADAQNLASIVRYEDEDVDRVYVLDNGFDDSHPRCVELNGTVQTLAWTRASSENRLQHPNCVRTFAPFFED